MLLPLWLMLGSSPHTRGALDIFISVHYQYRIIPAYAGSTALAEAGQERAAGSSPHTRGALLVGPEPLRTPGIIPAYAGSTTTGRACRLPAGDHPRIRGEHSVAARLRDGRGRIIPAYAGSTQPPNRPGGAGTDHPRIRGEHHRPPQCDSPPRGSSPHTRGARTWR